MTDREKIKEALEELIEFYDHYAPHKFKDPNLDRYRAALLLASQADTKPAGGEWLPIESAPRDGTEILGYWSLGHGSHGCTKFLKGEWVNPEDCDDEYCAPDFWQPLPAPPLTRKENGE